MILSHGPLVKIIEKLLLLLLLFLPLHALRPSLDNWLARLPLISLRNAIIESLNLNRIFFKIN